MFIIDFDDTLFNTRGDGGFKAARLAALKEIGVDEDVYKETYTIARNHPDGRVIYGSERHAEILAARGFDRNMILEAFASTAGDRLKEFLFADTISFLETLKSCNQPMVLLSLGDPEFQYMKVKGTGVAEYFDRTFMVMRKNVEVMKELLDEVHDDEIWFINDKVEETKVLHQAYPDMKVVLKVSPSFDRKEYEESGLPYFDTLSEIQDYVAQTR